MFEKWKKAALKTEIKELEEKLEASVKDASQTRTELRIVTDQLADLKLKKKIEEEDIKHMVKMKEERNEVENEKKLLEMEREKDKAIADAKDKFRDKLESFLQEQVKDTKDMYGEILQRLPDVTAHFGTPRNEDK
jgi:hypothetical protein